MKEPSLKSLTEAELVNLFTLYALKQDEHLLANDPPSKINRLFLKIEGVKAELKSRTGDGRHALIALYKHPNPQVQLKAAIATLALSPKAARNILEKLRTCMGPQCLDAGMTIRALDQGIFKPT